MRVANARRRDEGSRGTDSRRLNVNLSSSDTTGTEASPWEWFAAISSRLVARLFKTLIEFFNGK